jgi:hypothetical protein
MGLGGWVYRGAIYGANAGCFLSPFLVMIYTGNRYVMYGGMLCYGPPAALFGGLIGVVVAIIGFAVTRGPSLMNALWYDRPSPGATIAGQKRLWDQGQEGRWQARSRVLSRG